LDVIEIRSFKTFYALKLFIWQWLSEHNVFMRLLSLWWFSHMNPIYHSKELIKNNIYDWMTNPIQQFIPRRAPEANGQTISIVSYRWQVQNP
jgi:hypothetical protein